MGCYQKRAEPYPMPMRARRSDSGLVGWLNGMQPAFLKTPYPTSVVRNVNRPHIVHSSLPSNQQCGAVALGGEHA